MSLRALASTPSSWASRGISAAAIVLLAAGSAAADLAPKLTNDDLDQIQGRTEQLVGKIQERYGIARDEAERQVNGWNPLTP